MNEADELTLTLSKWAHDARRTRNFRTEFHDIEVLCKKIKRTADRCQHKMGVCRREKGAARIQEDRKKIVDKRVLFIKLIRDHVTAKVFEDVWAQVEEAYQ